MSDPALKPEEGDETTTPLVDEPGIPGDLLVPFPFDGDLEAFETEVGVEADEPELGPTRAKLDPSQASSPDGLDSSAETVSTVATPEAGVWAFLKSHPQEFMTGAAAVFLVVVLVELFKPWLRGVAKRRSWDDHDSSKVMKTMPYIFGIGIAYVFDFRSNWLGLTGSELTMVESIFVGALFTGAGAQLAYMAAKEFRIVEVIRLRWYRFMGVTNEDLDAIAKTDPIGPNSTEGDSEDFEDDSSEDSE